jgi:hypothetical protein
MMKLHFLQLIERVATVVKTMMAETGTRNMAKGKEGRVTKMGTTGSKNRVSDDITKKMVLLQIRTTMPTIPRTTGTPTALLTVTTITAVTITNQKKMRKDTMRKGTMQRGKMKPPLQRRISLSLLNSIQFSIVLLST